MDESSAPLRMRARRVATVLFLAAALGLAQAHAQSAGVTLRGEAYDSLRHQVLANAFITVAGVRSVTTDGRGRFQLDGVPPGEHRLEMQHAVLDSIGLSGVSVRTLVTDGLDYLTIAVPSFATLWRAACGERAAPKDSGFIYGTTRDARTAERVPGAVIDLVWFDIAVTSERRLKQRLLRNQTTSDANGEFSVCGVSMDQGIRLMASTDSAASGMIDVLMSTLPVQRRDLLVGTGDPALAASLGSVEGVVTDEGGAPVEGARVVLEEIPRAITGPDGRFVVRDIVPGTRQLEVLAASRRPVLLLVDVKPAAAATLQVRPTRVTTVAEVRVPGSPWQARLISELDAHRRASGIVHLDSGALRRLESVPRALGRLREVKVSRGSTGRSELLLLDGRKGRCVATIWLDGIAQSDASVLTSLPVEVIAVLEVFADVARVPWRYGSAADCGAVAAWTKAALR